MASPALKVNQTNEPFYNCLTMATAISMNLCSFLFKAPKDIEPSPVEFLICLLQRPISPLININFSPTNSYLFWFVKSITDLIY